MNCNEAKLMIIKNKQSYVVFPIRMQACDQVQYVDDDKTFAYVSKRMAYMRCKTITGSDHGPLMHCTADV